MKAKQLQAVELLSTGATVTATAQRLGIGRRTLQVWMKRPDFRQALAETRREQWAALLGRLHSLASDATAALGDVLRDPPNAALRLRAADITLGKLAGISQVRELEDRLARLEAELDQMQQEGGGEGTA